MKVYVASWFDNRENVKLYNQMLIEHGHVITCDWTDDLYDGSEEFNLHMSRAAQRDERGVVDCDALVLVHGDLGRACHSELGMALALGKIVIVVNGFRADARQNLFFYLPRVYNVNTIEEAIDLISDLSA